MRKLVHIPDMAKPFSIGAQLLRNLVTAVIGKMPVGIWVAWGALVYAMVIFRGKLEAFMFFWLLPWQAIVEYFTTWVVLLATASALSRRRAIGRIFGGMAMTLLYFHALFHSDPVGMVLALCGTFSFIATRRWFDETLPRTR